MRLDLNGENVKDGKHFQAQKNEGNHGHRDGKDLAEIEAAAPGLETSRNQPEDVQGRKTKNQYPENVVDVALLAGKFTGKLKREEQRRLQANQTRHQPTLRRHSCNRTGKG